MWTSQVRSMLTAQFRIFNILPLFNFKHGPQAQRLGQHGRRGTSPWIEDGSCRSCSRCACFAVDGEASGSSLLYIIARTNTGGLRGVRELRRPDIEGRPDIHQLSHSLFALV